MKLNDLEQLASGFKPTQKMPVLFLGHGSPMNAIEENQFVSGFRKVASEIPTPNAIICISAHWYTRGTFVTAMELPKTIHDFGGFPQALFDVQYPAPGDPKLAQQTKELLHPVSVHLDDSWGLDHGAWSVIRHMYPQADIPVIQLSIDYTKDPAYHYDLAKRLARLRNSGILIIGSGNIVHNLRLIDWKNINTIGAGWDWAIEAHEKTSEWLLDGNIQPLIHYQKQGTALQYAVPSPDHFLPLIYSLGLRDEKEEITLFNNELIGGSLSMTSVKIEASS